ncbi:MAG TPA: deoxyribodipyrimidine photo-lyase [Natrialbaceae archaeon]|nr:deoxyribodipyrimidine photo-lyase [Natrialbaceae archaeon]
MQLHWHRRDLRVRDNVGLASAGRDSEDPILPVFVFDDRLLEAASPPRVAALLDGLRSLRERYRDRGSDLVVVEGNPTEELRRLANEYGIDRVHWNRDYSGVARRRDESVRDVLEGEGVDVDTHHDPLLHEPGSITTNDGTHYAVYSYFWKKWRDRAKDDPVEPPEPDDLAEVEGKPFPTLEALGFEPPEASIPDVTPAAARERLDSFCADGIYRYEERRDYPADDATSRLSVHLKYGTIGIRTVYAATAQAFTAAEDDAAGESVREFQSQLAWREFYTHVLAANPGAVTENYKDYEHDIEWRTDPEGLEAWKAGETGYPIVDAGMRQLRQEAWMHNRVRMIVASFLTKDLLIDWREGYDWFRERLVDHDTANDNGGWQWAASTGTDAQPFFRIFNPMTQGERYDPDAEYVTEYVPELRDATPDRIHGWHELSDAERESIAPDYPAPIVDHAEARERTLATFRAARGESE